MSKEYSTIIHPYSAGLLILLDNAFFGANALTLGLSTPLMAALAFSVTGTGVFLIQKFLVKESIGESIARAFFIGILAGIPTSIFGTAVGLFVLAKAGLANLSAKKQIPHDNQAKSISALPTSSITPKSHNAIIGIVIIALLLLIIIFK